jgi:hypothetical protein
MLWALTNLPLDARAQKLDVRQKGPGGGWRAEPAEATQLPKFCWAQYLGVKGPEYEISAASCGYGMNHYCYGLVEIQRGNKVFGNPTLKKQYFLAAREHTLYTIRAMEKFPTCSLRPHVEGTRQQVEAVLRIYGVK